MFVSGRVRFLAIKSSFKHVRFVISIDQFKLLHQNMGFLCQVQIDYQLNVDPVN